jgi:hypothetical protein
VKCGTSTKSEKKEVEETEQQEVEKAKPNKLGEKRPNKGRNAQKKVI